MPDDSRSPSGGPSLGRRVRAMGSSGWEAYTVGFTLVGCILAGALVGWLLDNRFGTGYWLPIGFLIGVVAGFREMFVVIKRVSERANAQKLAERAAAAQRTYTPPRPDESVEAPKGRERLFAVPPPPLEGYAVDSAEAASARSEPETTGEILERLLGESKEEWDAEMEKLRDEEDETQR